MSCRRIQPFVALWTVSKAWSCVEVDRVAKAAFAQRVRTFSRAGCTRTWTAHAHTPAASTFASAAWTSTSRMSPYAPVVSTFSLLTSTFTPVPVSVRIADIDVHPNDIDVHVDRASVRIPGVHPFMLRTSTHMRARTPSTSPTSTSMVLIAARDVGARGVIGCSRGGTGRRARLRIIRRQHAVEQQLLASRNVRLGPLPPRTTRLWGNPSRNAGARARTTARPLAPASLATKRQSNCIDVRADERRFLPWQRYSSSSAEPRTGC